MSTQLLCAAKTVFLNGVLFVLLLSSGCSIGVDGDGQRTEELRDLQDFASVVADGSLDVKINQGEITSVVVSIDSNLQRRVRTQVRDGGLVIDVSDPIGDTVAGPHVIVTMPRLRSARLVGSGNLSAGTFRQDDAVELGLEGSGDLSFSGDVTTLAAELEGSGDMRLAGTATAVVLSLQGSGDLRAADLSSASADLRLGGSGNLAATVTGPSRVALDGSGDIDLFGGGPIEASSVSGSGQVRAH
jgi:hypothetical protein